MLTRRIRLIGLTMAAACLGWSASAIGQLDLSLQKRQAESQVVEDYLKSLQLDDLVIEHLEVETSREIDREARQQMAASLLNEYAERMISGRVQAGSNWQLKAKLLLQTYPVLSTPTIRIAILQAKYRSHEEAFQKWWDSGRDNSLQGDLVSRWYELKTELETLNRQLETAYEDHVALLNATPGNSDSQTRQLARLDGLLLHTDYLIGWSSYFLGVLIPENRKQLMLASDSHFRSFLQIEPKKTLTEVSPEWFDFSSDWNSRALVGLAMCQRALNHPLQSKYCFELIQNHAINQRTREQRYVWDLNSRVYLNEASAALEIVDSVGEARHISESGRTAFWLATLNASVATRNQAPAISRRLLRSGLSGLARQFDAKRIENFLQDNRIQIDGEDFLSLWIAGYLDFSAAVNSHNPKQYDQAKIKLTAALSVIDEKTNPSDIARCRFLLAKIQLHNREYEAAAKVFLECSKSFEKTAPEWSAESMWLAVRSLSEQCRTNPRLLIQANRAIDQLMRRYPGSTFAKRAEFERLRLDITGLTADEAIGRLSRIKPTDSNYPLVANEIIKIRYTSWLDANQSRSESEWQKFEALREAESIYQRQTAASDESKLKSQLLVFDAMLKTESIEKEDLRNCIDRLEARAESVGSNNPVYAEYRYYRFLYANRLSDQPQATAEAQWLSENASGTQFEKSATILLAQLVDEILKSQTAPLRDDLAKAKTVFTKLVDLLGSSESDLKQSPNARVAYARLAALKLASGSNDEAIEMLVSLNTLFPNHKSYLRQLGLTYTQSHQYSNAISIWKKLIRGVDPGSEVWLESKYNLAFCLYHSGNREEARELHEQTRRLCPALPENWINRFDKLSEILIED